LAGHCFKCHGPDERARKARLRLDSLEYALRGGRSGMAAIVPGKPLQSELVRRTHSDDENEVMPPPGARNPLTAARQGTRRRWVAAGPGSRPPWAFVPPRQTSPPAMRHTGWPRNPIDVFVLARLEAEGLAPSPQADRWTLVRRLYLDLVG